MNRKDRRKFVKDAKKKGISKGTAEAYLAIKEMGLDLSAAVLPKEFNEGDRVRLDTERIKSQKNYENKSEMYRNFIDANADTVFEIGPSKGNLCTIKDQPWVFYSGDLIRVKEDSEESVEE